MDILEKDYSRCAKYYLHKVGEHIIKKWWLYSLVEKIQKFGPGRKALGRPYRGPSYRDRKSEKMTF
jgi:hypothetical protein